MKKVSLRDFRLKANLYLNELPITLTVYDKPVAIVNTFSKDVNTISTIPPEIGEKKIGVPPYVVLKNPPNTVKFEAGAEWIKEHKKGDRDGEWIWEWCALNDFTHPFEKGVIRKCKRVTVVDSVNDGDAYINGKFYRSQLICEDCLAKIDEKEGITYNEEEI